jgi:hypothetical protein
VGINLNKVDKDGPTVIDYIDEKLKKTKSPAIESELTNYKRFLIHYGARNAKDLERK